MNQMTHCYPNNILFLTFLNEARLIQSQVLFLIIVIKVYQIHSNQCYLWVSNPSFPRGDFREETQRKPLPKIAKNRAELEFGQVMASQNYGASTSLINCGNVQ